MTDLRRDPEMFVSSPSLSKQKLIGETVTKGRKWMLAALVGLGIPGLGMAGCVASLALTGGVHDYSDAELMLHEDRNAEIDDLRSRNQIPLKVYVECDGYISPWHNPVRDQLGDFVALGSQLDLSTLISVQSDWAYGVLVRPPVVQKMKKLDQCIKKAMPGIKFKTPEPPK